MATRRANAVTIVKEKSRIGKRGKVTKPGCGGVKTGLKLNLLPFDILYEIASNLKPIDILNLARTSKALRSRIMSKTSAFIWKATFSQIETKLPDLPEDMSIPAIVSLAFDNQCQICGTSWPNDLDKNCFRAFKLRVRLCQFCADEQLICIYEESSIFDVLEQCLPNSIEYYDLKPAVMCLQSDFEEFYKEYHSPESDSEALVSERMSALRKREDYMDCWADWHRAYENEIRSDLVRTRFKRYDDIRDRLSKLGYDEELSYIDHLPSSLIEEYPGVPKLQTHLLYHPLVDKYEPLKDEEWASIRKSMRRYMEKVKAHYSFSRQLKAESERKTLAADIYQRELRKLPPGSLVPSIVDLYEWELVNELIKKPFAETITEQKMEEVIQTNMEEWLTVFREQQVYSLARIINRDVEPKDGSLSDLQKCQQKLELATSTLLCRSMCCRYDPDFEDPNTDLPLFYPQSLHHQCNSLHFRNYGGSSSWAEKVLDKDTNLSIDQQHPRVRQSAWSTRNLSLHINAQAIVWKIVQACGLDPGTTTVADMDTLDARVVCLKCSYGAEPDGERIFSAFPWRMALRHCLKKHWGSDMIEWVRLSEPDANKARTMELHEAELRGARPHEPWRCVHCRHTRSDLGPMGMAEILFHCEEMHGVDEHDCEEGRDFYRTLETPPCQPYIIRMVPSPV